MRKWTVRPGARLPAILVLLGAAACGSGGGGGGTSGGASGGIGDLGVVGHQPAVGAVQVALDASVEITFDGAIDGTALSEDEFQLTTGTEGPITGTFATRQGGKTVVFKPDQPLAKATDYTFTLQPTLCDTSFRTLDRKYSFSFRSFDDVPPTVASASVTNNQTGVSRVNPITVQFDEPMAPASITGSTVTVKDNWGNGFPLDLTLSSSSLVIQPRADLPGSRSFVLSIRSGTAGVTDKAGNALASTWTVKFTSAPDTVPPLLLSSDPFDLQTGVSPHARLAFKFSESMDPTSYEPTGLVIRDSFLNPVAFAVTATPDQKTIFLKPLSPMTADESYTVTFKSGPVGMTDVSGLSLAADAVKRFTTGSDVAGPTVSSTEPKADEARISPNAVIELWFSEAVKNATISRKTVSLSDGTKDVYITPSISTDGTKLTVTPGALLASGTTHTLTLVGGYDGIQDRAGNPLAADWAMRFTTSSSQALPAFVVSPPSGASGVPVTSRITAVASAPLDPATVNSWNVRVKKAGGDTISGSLTLERGNRAIVFDPLGYLPSNEDLIVTIAGGYGGVRLANGNWRSADDVTHLRVGFHLDSINPELDLSLNDIAKTRSKNIVVPPFGFVLRTSAFDPGNTSIDPSTLQLTLTGPGSVPSPDELFLLTTFSSFQSTTRIDAANALPEGTYVLTATAKDLSGNTSPPQSVSFEVATATVERRPFERTQIVWVRFDMDREGSGKGNGVVDFDQDLLDTGLMAEGDPAGRNAYLKKLVIDGALKIANELFQRAADSSPKDTNSVRMRLTTRQPCRAPHMKIAVGGLDPGGNPGRKYGDESTGILGRAFFDYRNGTPNENNAGTSPGLGVFVGELFLYQARLYLDLYPYYITTFGRTFRGLSPHMGGKPAGTHALDATVLADNFNYNQATPNERARYDEIMKAADDLAVSVGVVLAHEIGHSVGLVATGPLSGGLHGDSSLHNATTGITDVMGAVIGYESLVTVDFAFRPLNLSYLQERILLK